VAKKGMEEMTSHREAKRLVDEETNSSRKALQQYIWEREQKEKLLGLLLGLYDATTIFWTAKNYLGTHRKEIDQLREELK